jgi:hypothetical protein
VPLRLPRLAQAVAVIGLASAPLLGFVVPAHADAWRQSEWWLTRLHVVQAWRSGEGAGVTIAVLADGVVARQADLTGRVVTGPDFTGSHRVPGGPHYGVIGTGLASLIAGHGHGSKTAQGIYGVASDARILSVRVTLSPDDPLWTRTALTSRLPGDIAAGIRYAVKHDASVIALPADPGMPGIPHWGGARSAAGGSAAERAAIGYAIRRGVLLVAPAGDNALAGNAPNYPAAYQGVIAVGAFDRNFVKAPTSNRQRYVMLTAAGRGVVAAAPAGYQRMNSTWAASAIVAGVASLVRSQFPGLTASQVMKAMTHGTFYRPLGGLRNGSGYGTVDAAKAISEAATMSPPHAKPASLGALPRRVPATPSVPSNGSVIARDLLTDGILSAGLLACLLVPITWYGSIIKRRDRRVALAAADRAQHSRLGYGGGLGADPMTGYFGPQDVPAGPGPRRAAGTRYQPRPSLSGRSTLTPAFAPQPMLPSPPMTADTADPFAAQGQPAAGGFGRTDDAWGSSGAWGTPDGWSGADAWSGGEAVSGPRAWGDSPGAAAGSRPPGTGQGHSRTLRQTPVAGAPPWEPAPEPTSELPWAVLSGPAQGPARRPGLGAGTRQAPPESIWDPRTAAQSPAPGSLFDPDASEDRGDAGQASVHGQGSGRVAGPDRRDDSDWRSITGHRSGTGERPIYVWDPETSADDGTIRLTRSYQG